GFGRAGLRPEGDDRFTTGIEPWGDWGRHPPPGAWHFYSYWHQMKGAPDGKYWGNGFAPEQPALVLRDRWTCVEFTVQANSGGQANGGQAFWIDGELVGKFDGIAWRTDDGLKINAFWLLFYVTGNEARQNRVAPTPVSRVYFDDVVVATEYIGPRVE
ncbi:hypothetical protein HYY27_09000, partial [bacterium]|nr:hypothetical protein [bacterium]